jgi:predicted NAD/FAD-binding protein
MGAAIWSTPASEIEAFPARSFLHFFYNHRLINHDRPQWRTVRGGSREYVRKLSAATQAHTILNAQVTSVERRDDKVFVHANGQEEEAFDEVVFATHSDQALAALTDASAEERAILSAVRYLPNQVYLHCDDQLMPKRRSVWSAWNYLTDGRLSQNGTMTVSYWMNLLQNLDNGQTGFCDAQSGNSARRRENLWALLSMTTRNLTRRPCMHSKLWTQFRV